MKITYDSINATGSDNAIVSIVYKGQAWFLEFHGRDYNGEGQINYSVLDMNSPVIYFKFSTISAMNTVLISYDGADFFVNTIDSKSATYYPSWGEESCEEYNAIMEIPFKYSYLQGKKILNEKESQYVFTDINEPRDDYNDNHMFTFLGIQGVSFLKDVYFQTYITDDNLRLRTSNSKDGNVITHLSKGPEVRVINIDPAKTQMEGKAGFWVLIETNDRYVGWIWSNYLKNFDYDFK